MELFEIIACARSGHHAVINWMVKNLTGELYPPNIKIKPMLESDLLYINEGNFNTDRIKNFLPKEINKFKTFLISYEDVYPNFTLFSDNKTFKGINDFNYLNIEKPTKRKRIIIIRDFYNSLSSRIKTDRFNTNYERFIDKWKEQANYIINNKIIYIKYEDWLLNPEIRQQFLEKVFGIQELYDNKHISHGNSSFKNSNTESLLNRYKDIDIPEELRNYIEKDSELHYLIGKLDYNYLNMSHKNKIIVEYLDGYAKATSKKFNINATMPLNFLNMDTNIINYTTQVTGINQWHKTTIKAKEWRVTLGDHSVTVSEEFPKKIINL